MSQKKILMPRIGVNDDCIMLVEWLVKDGQKVTAQQELALLESTKKTTELYSPVEGYIHLNAEAEKEYPVGAILATVDEDQCQNLSFKSDIQGEKETGLHATRKAHELIIKNNIDLKLLPQNRLIREKDVLPLISHSYTLADVTGNHLLIYGIGGFTREIIEVVRQTNAYRPICIINGIVGDMTQSGEVMGVPVLSGQELERLYQEGCHKAVNAVAVNPSAFSRKNIYLALKKRNFDFPNIIHKTAEIDSDVVMGEGNLILSGVFIGAATRIGSDCIINVHATISHQCVISDHCHIASGAVLAGEVTVGENTLIGQGCTIYHNVTIGKNVVIYNGCNIYKNVPDGNIVKK